MTTTDNIQKTECSKEIVKEKIKETPKTLLIHPDENKKLCDGCVMCCSHINSEIDVPENDEDCDYIIWFLLHENVAVWIDDEKDWYVEFKTPCKAIKNELCSVYEKRPKVCREYDQDDCLKNAGYDDDIYFSTPEEFLAYMKNVKKYDYNGFYKENK